MDNVNKTLYIPLYGKAYVSKKGIILDDRKAEEIWAAEGFALGRRSRSKWLAYYMGMRAAVFDGWLRNELAGQRDAVVLHIGCGLDSRVLRAGAADLCWYDVDLPEVIRERKRYYPETGTYHMIGTDVRDGAWIGGVPGGRPALVIMEGISMYLPPEELRRLLSLLRAHFDGIRVLVDCYTPFAARASRWRNPINDVGGAEVYGIDGPGTLEEGTGLSFVREHEITPQAMIDSLKGIERAVFKTVYAGRVSRKIYRLYEYRGG